MNHPRCTTCPIAGPCVQEWTGHSTYCDWTARGGNYLRRVEELSAAGPPEPEPMRTAPAAPAEYPSLLTQAGNALGALARVVGAVVTGQAVAVDAAEQARRLEICRACDQFDAVQQRCRICGCVNGWKARLATEHCPLVPPKW